MGLWSFVYSIIPDVWFKGMTLRSYTGVMLVNSIKLRRRDRRLRKALKRLNKKYTPDRIANLYKKYSRVEKESPSKEQKRLRKFQKKLGKLVNNFLNDYAEFRAYYLDTLQLIAQSLLGGKRESYKEFTGIEALFAQLEAKKSELIFPMREIETFKGQIAKLLRDIARDIRMDELSDIRVERGGYPAGLSVFAFKRWWSRAKLYRKEKREIKRLGRNLELYEQIYNRVLQELQSGVQQDFLFLLIEVFKRVDVADKRLEEIKQDLMIVLKRLSEEVTNVKNSLHNLLTLLRNESQIKNNPQFAKIEEDITKLENIFKQMVQQDFKNTEALRKKLNEMLQESNVVIAEMQEQAMKIAA